MVWCGVVWCGSSLYLSLSHIDKHTKLYQPSNTLQRGISSVNYPLYACDAFAYFLMLCSEAQPFSGVVKVLSVGEEVFVGGHPPTCTRDDP